MTQRGDYVLERSQFVHAPVDKVFEFFADAANLQRITPTFLDFEIATPQPIDLHVGTRIEYRLKLFWIRFRWKTLIEEFAPPQGFVDLQTHGPYQKWRHRHWFEPADDGTWIHDRVDYRIGWGPLGPLAYRLFVRHTLNRVFDYRRAEIDAVFHGQLAQSEQPTSATR